MAGLQDNVTFILVRTQFASNLGSAVRVMHNMGFSRLLLVRPGCEVGVEARSYAMRGASILDRAVFFPSLEAATCRLGALAATTGALGGSGDRTSSLRSFAEELGPRLAGAGLGLVFGSENNGLEKGELQLCQYLVEIPTGSDYTSLNLAQAVAVAAYETRLALTRQHGKQALRAAPAEQIQPLLKRIEEVVTGLGQTGIPSRSVIARIRRIAARAELEPADVKMLMGLLKR